jgi:hypothetical protein
MTRSLLPLILVTLAAPAAAITDWRKDGRVGYESREIAQALAEAFTAEDAPFAGKRWRVVADPDGGFTPVFFDPPREPGS